ncbi:MAG: hypothetical protein HQK75_19835, partial [Candidatus Magnetomorum sp.]|nr:hypothetical protein [Candidatus Magnetomorum sp.]
MNKQKNKIICSVLYAIAITLIVACPSLIWADHFDVPASTRASITPTYGYTFKIPDTGQTTCYANKNEITCP